MSTKHIRSTGDLVRFGADLKVDCGFCHAARTLTGVETVQTFGLGSLSNVRARLKCIRCGKKEARVTVLDPV